MYKNFLFFFLTAIMSLIILDDQVDQYRVGFSSRGLKDRETLPPAVRYCILFNDTRRLVLAVEKIRSLGTSFRRFRSNIPRYVGTDSWK